MAASPPPFPVKFAVQREDAAVELALVERFGARRVLGVASGGCTALELLHRRPELELTLFDLNPAQLELVAAKVRELRAVRGDAARARWRVGADDGEGPLGCGGFEGLFRTLRAFLHGFVWGAREVAEAFGAPGGPATLLEGARRSPYWPLAFELAFADPLLRTLFGDAAVQHPPRSGYPRHFQRAFEEGMARPDARANRFLQLLLLGFARDEEGVRPGYLAADSGLLRARDPELVLGTLGGVPRLERFDLLSLSNLTDWMDRAQRDRFAADLTAGARPGAVVLLRAIGSLAGMAERLGPAWTLEHALSAELLAADRSLFYSELLVARRR